MFSILSIFWFFREAKHILFWIFLWQLKEYHVGRLLDHLQTHKGRSLILNPLLFAKIILLILFLQNNALSSFVFAFLFLIYFFESAVFLKSLLSKQAKMPVGTFKARFLLVISFAIAVSFIPLQFAWLLAFDILTPLFISAVVLFFQPFSVYARNKVLKNAAAKRNSLKNLTVIGITGSYGKTSTKEFLATILSKKFNVAATKEHQNSEIGIAKYILNDLNSKHQIFIVEMGAYKKGGIRLLCSIVKPKIGIVTGVNEQHLALFGSLENLLSAEGGGELADALPRRLPDGSQGILAVNGDNKYCLDLLRKSSNLPANQEKKYTLGNKSIDADIWTEDILVEKDSVSFLAVNKLREMAHFKVGVLGRQNIQNLLAAVLIARELGMSIEEISDACKNIKQEQAGMVLKKGKLGVDIIDSSYSANPSGVFADLEYLNIFTNKKAIIMPCLIELGPKSAEIHKKIGQKIGEVCSLAIITSKDKFEYLKKGAVESGMRPGNILLCDKPEEISTIISLFCKSGDAVLLEGRIPPKVIELLTNEQLF